MSFEAVAFPKSESISVRELPPEETQRLVALQDQQGWHIPLPHLAAASVAEVDGEIVGFIVLQMLPNLGPIWVKEEFRGKGVPEMLIEDAKARAKNIPVLCIAGNPFVEKLCRENGMQEVPGKIFARW